MESRLVSHFDSFSENNNARISGLESAILQINASLQQIISAPHRVPADCSVGKGTTGPLAEDSHKGKGPGGNRTRRVLDGTLPTSSVLSVLDQGAGPSGLCTGGPGSHGLGAGVGTGVGWDQLGGRGPSVGGSNSGTGAGGVGFGDGVNNDDYLDDDDVSLPSRPSHGPEDPGTVEKDADFKWMFDLMVMCLSGMSVVETGVWYVVYQRQTYDQTI